MLISDRRQILLGSDFIVLIDCEIFAVIGESVAASRLMGRETRSWGQLAFVYKVRKVNVNLVCHHLFSLSPS